MTGSGDEGSALIDAYIAQAAPFARLILAHLRALVHEGFPGIGEAIKWGMPHFVLDGRNLAGMAAFTAHCAFVIHGEGRKGGAMGQYGRIASLDDLPPAAELLASLRAAAEKVSTKRQGAARAIRSPREPLPMPPEFSDALAAVPGAMDHYDSFTPGQQREYLEWLGEAKTDTTRARRMAEAVGWIAEGKKRNWKYAAQRTTPR